MLHMIAYSAITLGYCLRIYVLDMRAFCVGEMSHQGSCIRPHYYVSLAGLDELIMLSRICIYGLLSTRRSLKMIKSVACRSLRALCPPPQVCVLAVHCVLESAGTQPRSFSGLWAGCRSMYTNNSSLTRGHMGSKHPTRQF